MPIISLPEIENDETGNVSIDTDGKFKIRLSSADLQQRQFFAESKNRLMNKKD